MVEWYWLIIAGVIGGMIGLFGLALCVAAKEKKL